MKVNDPAQAWTPEALAKLSPDQQRELLAQLLAQKAGRGQPMPASPASSVSPPSTQTSSTQPSQLVQQSPMSVGQQGLWHAFRRDPTATAFNVFLPIRYRNRLDADSLRRALQEVVIRHPSLRTTFADHGGELVQIVHEHLPPEFSVMELLGTGIEQVRQIVGAEPARPFDLESGPLLRMKLYKLAADDWIVLAVTHHIIVDFWSLVVILRDIRVSLSGQRENFSSLADSGTYPEFVQEQTQFLSSRRGEQHREYWKQQTSRGSHVLELPLDRFRPSAFTGRAASVPLSFSSPLSRSMIECAKRLQATPFAVVLAGLAVLLSRYSGQASFYIGSPFSGRRWRRYEETVGFFVNMLPILAEVEPEQSFNELVHRTADTIAQALDHEMVPVAEIVRDADVTRDPSRSPLFQVSCTYEKSHLKEEAGRAGFLFQDQQLSWDFAGLRQESFYVPHKTCHYDLEFIFEQGADRLLGQLVYCGDLFTRESMSALAANLSSLLDVLLTTPHVPLRDVGWESGIAHSSREQFVAREMASLETTAELTPDSQTVPGLIFQATHRLRERSTAVALQSGSLAITYAQLLAQATQLAEQLQDQGVGPGSLVPLVAQRGPIAMVAALGIQLSGAAAVPLDATQPAIHWHELLEQTQPSVIVLDQLESLSMVHADQSVPSLSVAEMLAAGENVSDHTETLSQLLEALSSESVAYVIFTSGSTGKPKGVVVEHRAIANTLRWRMQATALTEDDRVLMLLSHQFDAGLGISWTALTQGARLVWPDQSSTGKFDPHLLLEQIAREEISVLPAIPSLLKVLVTAPQFQRCSQLRYLWTGGEAMTADLPQLVRQRSTARLWNFYGPTEAAVEATAMDVTDQLPDRAVPIGYPIANTEVVILDELLRPLPPTVPGEIAIAGAGLARGYLNDVERTNSRFIDIPHVDLEQFADKAPQRRVYRTGDRGRQLVDGSIEFLGRLDHQVKVSGYRIELEEVELAIQAHPEIVRTAAIVWNARDAMTERLAAYFTTNKTVLSDAEILSLCEQVKLSLRKRLAPYKIPTAWMHVSQLPLTTSGKVDRQRLPPFVPLPVVEQERGLKPRNDLESFLAAIWQGRLGAAVGVNRDFFQSGGSSLQAAAVTSEISSQLSVDVPTSLLFDLADVETVAIYLCEHYPKRIAERFGYETLNKQLDMRRSESSSTPTHPLVHPLKPTGNRVPLFLIHPPGGIVACYRELAEHLDPAQPLYAIRSRGLFASDERLPHTLEEMAADYLQGVESVVGPGPFRLGGWSLGGLVAYEMAQQSLAAGREVERLILLDTTIPEGATDLVPAGEQFNVGLEYGIDLTLDQLGQLTPEEQLPFLYEHARQLGVLIDEATPEVVERTLRDLQRLFHHHLALSQKYRLHPLPIHIHLLRPKDVPFQQPVRDDRGWGYLVRSVQVAFVPGHHHSMVQSPNVQTLAKVLSQ